MSWVAIEAGFSLVEVMIAMVISGVALTGTMGAMEMSTRYALQGQLSTRALAFAQARLEAKRSVRWPSLLEDDLDHDGVPETLMKDDGHGPDRLAGDGIYSSKHEQDGVAVVWTIEPDGEEPWPSAPVVVVRATAFYDGGRGMREIHMATLRANPTFVRPQ
jgi:prepilin-type N-terminal cleavage/methylation domain-containing protein